MIPSPKIYLSPTPSDSAATLSLKSWLCGIPPRDGFLSASPSSSTTSPHDPPFPLDTLSSALRLAISEILVTIDTEMEDLIATAARPPFHVRVDEDAFWAGRALDTERLRSDDFRASLGRDAITRALEAARAEIAWLENEHARLRLHMEIARAQVESGWRTSFVYRALPRRG